MKKYLSVISIMCICSFYDVKAQDDPVLDDVICEDSTPCDAGKCVEGKCVPDSAADNTKPKSDDTSNAQATGNTENATPNQAVAQSDPNKLQDGVDCTKHDQCASGFCGFTGQFRFQASMQKNATPDVTILVCKTGEAFTTKTDDLTSIREGPCKAYFDARQEGGYVTAQTHCPLYQCQQIAEDKKAFLVNPESAGSCSNGWDPDPSRYNNR